MRRGRRDCRYYPNDSELQYLISKIKAYFDYGERSIQRNQLAASVADHLKRLNPHWTHRAVRLWFNNNRRNFLPPETCDLSQKSQNEPQHRKFNNQSNSTPLSSDQTTGSVEDLKTTKQAEELETLFLTYYNSNQSSVELKREINEIQLFCRNNDIDPMSFLGDRLIVLPSFVKHQISIPNLLNPPNNLRAPSPCILSGFWLYPRFIQDISVNLENHFISFISNKISTFINQTPAEPVKNSPNNRILSFKNTFSHDNWTFYNFQSNLPLKSIFSFENFIWCTDGVDVFLYQINLSQNNLVKKEINFFPQINQNLNLSVDGNISINYIDENKIILTRNNFNPRVIHFNSILNELTESLIEFPHEKDFACTETFDDNLIFAHKNSSVFKMVDLGGDEQRAFVGHTHNIAKLKKINKLLFSAETGSILIWDVREQKPVFGIPLPPSLQVNAFSSFDTDFNVNSNLNTIAFALNDDKIRFIDMRNSKSVNGVVTTMGRVESFASSNDGMKLSLFTSGQNGYWECHDKLTPLFVN